MAASRPVARLSQEIGHHALRDDRVEHSAPQKRPNETEEYNKSLLIM